MAVQNMQMYTQQSAPGMMGNRSANTGWDWSGEISVRPFIPISLATYSAVAPARMARKPTSVQ